jgi:hypothetical protein
MRFTVTQAQVPTAARDEEINRTWFIKGTNEEGTHFMGYMPRDEVPDVKDSNELLGMVVEGDEHPVQRQPGRVWINYLRPCKEQPVRELGAFAELGGWRTHLQYRHTVNDAIGEISADLRDVSERINKAAAMLRSLKNL